jgi:hypothetical protein
MYDSKKTIRNPKIKYTPSGESTRVYKKNKPLDQRVGARNNKKEIRKLHQHDFSYKKRDDRNRKHGFNNFGLNIERDPYGNWSSPVNQKIDFDYYITFPPRSLNNKIKRITPPDKIIDGLKHESFCYIDRCGKNLITETKVHDENGKLLTSYFTKSKI